MPPARAANGSSRHHVWQMRHALGRLLAVSLVLLGLLAAYSRSRTVPGGVNPVYVALGASDAVGIGATRPTLEGWVPLVAAGLPPDAEVVDLGVSGATLADVLAGQLPVATDATPRWITIWPGPNDLRNGVPLATFAAQLDQLLAALLPPAGCGTARPLIAVLNLPDLRAVPAFSRTAPGTLDRQVREWNATIATIVSRHADSAFMVDLYAGWTGLATDPSYISGDGFHPSSAGYRQIADLTLTTLRAHDPSLPR